MDKTNKLILYKDDEGRISINVRFADEDVWLTRDNLADIYATTPQNISLHIGNIYQDKELTEEATRKKFFLVRQEGKRQVQREIDHYNLDMIIALGYRVQSPVAVRFRRWATQRLHEYIQKGFTLDDERLKQGGNRYYPSPHHRSHHPSSAAIVAELAEVDALPRAEVQSAIGDGNG